MKIYFLGAYSDIGLQGMMQSSFEARKGAVEAMLGNVGGSLTSMSYLQGPYDVIAELEVDSYETASGLRATMMLSGGWEEMLILPAMDINKALETAKKAGGYTMPGSE